MSALIVLIEDEEDLLELMEYRLEKEGYETEGFLSTKNVEAFLQEEEVDLMIVDRNLPGIEGSDFVETLRNKGITTPVIFVTAKVSESDIEEGFEKGGDDYITKPFNMNELTLRVKAILKRTQKVDEGKIAFRDIILDQGLRIATVGGVEISLTKLEFNLLSCFLKNKNSVLDREFLLEHVWKDETLKQEKTVNVTINRLKSKIDPDKSKEYIKSIRGVGYQLC